MSFKSLASTHQECFLTIMRKNKNLLKTVKKTIKFRDLVNLFNCTLLLTVLYKINKLRTLYSEKQKEIVDSIAPQLHKVLTKTDAITELQHNIDKTNETIKTISTNINILNHDISAKVVTVLSATNKIPPQVNVVNESPTKYIAAALIFTVIVAVAGIYIAAPKAVVLTKQASVTLTYSLNYILGRLPGTNTADSEYFLPQYNLKLITQIVRGVAEHKIENLDTKVQQTLEEFLLECAVKAPDLVTSPILNANGDTITNLVT